MLKVALPPEQIVPPLPVIEAVGRALTVTVDVALKVFGQVPSVTETNVSVFSVVAPFTVSVCELPVRVMVSEPPVKV